MSQNFPARCDVLISRRLAFFVGALLLAACGQSQPVAPGADATVAHDAGTNTQPDSGVPFVLQPNAVVVPAAAARTVTVSGDRLTFTETADNTMLTRVLPGTVLLSGEGRASA